MTGGAEGKLPIPAAAGRLSGYLAGQENSLLPLLTPFLVQASCLWPRGRSHWPVGCSGQSGWLVRMVRPGPKRQLCVLPFPFQVPVLSS